MAVGIAVYFLWKADPVGLQFPHPLFLATLVVCPAFILSIAGTTGVQPALAVVLLAGTIPFANGCLYAGAAAGLYAAITTVLKRKRSR